MKTLKTKILTAILCITMLFSAVGFSACGNNELEAKLAELQAQIEELEQENEELQEQISELENTVNILKLSEWQKISNENTFMVCVNITILGGDIKLEDFKGIKINKIVPIEGVIPRTKNYYNGTDLSEYALFAVQTQDASEDDLYAIQELEFVDYAWRNEYNYYANPAPTEEKDYVEIKDYWLGFHGTIDVTIDSGFDERIFTTNDFSLRNIVSVEWSSYERFKDRDDLGNYNHVFSVKISDYSDLAVESALVSLYTLNYVKKVLPKYAITDFPGYPV